jgi:hypothetical protein
MTEWLEQAAQAEVLAHDLAEFAKRLRAARLQGTPEVHSDAGICLSEIADDRLKGRRTSAAHLELARKIYQARRERDKLIPSELTGEPGWDILLDLYIKGLEGTDVSTTSACLGACVPGTTGLRWIGLIEEHNLVERYPARHDQRVTYVRLTPKGFRTMQRYLETLNGENETGAGVWLLRGK